MSDDVPMIDRAEVARILGISRRRVGELADGDTTFPRARELDRSALWPRRAIETWAGDHADRGDTYRPPRLPPPGDLAPGVADLVQAASHEARELNHDWIGVEHLVVAMVSPGCPGSAARVLKSFGLTHQTARRRLEDAFGDPFAAAGEWSPPAHSPRLQLVLERANLWARELRDEVVNAEHVLLALAEVWPDAPLLPGIVGDVDPDDIIQRIVAATEGRTIPSGPPAPVAPTDAFPLDLRLSPAGFEPRRRLPWTSRPFVEEVSGQPVMREGVPLQYLVDRDGHPVVTVDGDFVELFTTSGQPLVLSADRPHFEPVDLPPGARIDPLPA